MSLTIAIWLNHKGNDTHNDADENEYDYTHQNDNDKDIWPDWPLCSEWIIGFFWTGEFFGLEFQWHLRCRGSTWNTAMNESNWLVESQLVSWVYPQNHQRGIWILASRDPMRIFRRSATLWLRGSTQAEIWENLRLQRWWCNKDSWSAWHSLSIDSDNTLSGTNKLENDPPANILGRRIPVAFSDWASRISALVARESNNQHQYHEALRWMITIVRIKEVSIITIKWSMILVHQWFLNDPRALPFTMIS